MNNAEKIKIIASEYIESMTKAINNLAKAMNECANSLRVCAPELKKSIEKACDDRVLMDTFGTTDVMAIIKMVNRTWAGKFESEGE